jgi:sugar lactone lactonase YvrE
MKKVKRIIKWLFISIALLLLVFVTWFYFRYGGSGQPFANKATASLWPADSLHIVATLPEPPGNIAVSKAGRIFCTYHAEGRPDVKVWELVNGQPEPFPNRQWQSDANGKVYLDAIFNIRIDAQDHLWTLDHGQNGFKQPRLLCFDIVTRQLLKQIDLPSDMAGIGSYVQDMQVDTACQQIYIADLSAFGQKPALIVVDIATGRCRRLLEKHPSVMAGNYKVVNKGREMRPAGPLYHFHPAVDPIALDRKNEYLYYGAMSSEWMYRIKLSHLNDTALTAAQLGSKVEQYAQRGQCDGISMDNADNIYITDIENGSMAVLDSNRKYYTLVAHPQMRWPDGLSVGPDGYVYVADSDIPDVMLRSKKHIRQSGPYYLFKFKALAPAAAGQ